MSEPKLTEAQLATPAAAATLRDLFACFALVGNLASPVESVSTADFDRHAEWAYIHADAMLLRRQETSHD